MSIILKAQDFVIPSVKLLKFKMSLRTFYRKLEELGFMFTPYGNSTFEYFNTMYDVRQNYSNKSLEIYVSTTNEWILIAKFSLVSGKVVIGKEDYKINAFNHFSTLLRSIK